MTSITGWNRIEAVARDQGFREGLEAPVHDPAWMIARQWQVGEFRGEDAGSAVLARIRLKSQSVTGYRQSSGEGGDQPVGAGLPLEPLVEAEGPQEFGAPGWLDRSEAGLAFLRLLDQHPTLPEERAFWIAEHGFAPLSPAEAAAASGLQIDTYEDIRLFSPDGAALAPFLAQLIADSAPAPPAYAMTAAALAGVAAIWLDQWASVFAATPAHGSAWRNERLEHAFDLTLDGGEATLSAQGYHGGQVEWHAFDISSSGAEAGHETELARIPMPVGFAGMPAPRWWEFEDARFALPQIRAAPDDLIKLVLVDFALVYSGDWLMVPVELACGAVHRIASLTVNDNFDQTIDIGAIEVADDPLQDWTMYALSRAGTSAAPTPSDAGQVLFLPPASARPLNGPAYERVEIGRDEVANYALARERTIRAPTGRAQDRDLSDRLRQPPETPGDDVAPRYRLADRVPHHWIPLVPEVTADGRSTVLRRGAFLDPETGQPVEARSRTLVPEKPLRITEEEVSRVGLTVYRQARLARTSDGGTVLWHGRMRKPGKGDASGGVRFDRIEDA